MESLGELLRRMPRAISDEQFAARQAEMMRHPLMAQLKQEHPQLDDAAIRLNLNRLLSYIQDHDHCSHCPGLDRCPNDMPGHYTRLSIQSDSDDPAETHIYDYKASCDKWVNRQHEAALRERIRSFYVDDQALNRAYSFGDIVKVDLSRAKAVERIMDYITQTKDKGLQSEGLYLAGAFGTGKTFLICYLLRELAKVGHTGIIVYVPEFVEDLKSMFQEPQRMKETIDMMKETDLLVFDDIGAENTNPWVRDHVLGSILNYRMNRKPTFYTSNHDLNALEQHFSFTSKDGEAAHKGERIMERIRPYVEVIVVEGTNKRMHFSNNAKNRP